MRDVWLLLVVLAIAVWAGMSNPGAKPAAQHDMPAAMAGMGDMGAMSMSSGGVCPTGAAPAMDASTGGDACCPTDASGEAKHDCSEHEGQPCEQHEAAHAAAPAGELTADQMQTGVCPMGGAEGSEKPAKTAQPTEPAAH